MFLAQAVVARITFHALFGIDRRAPRRRIDIDRAHGTHVRAIPASYALVRIDLHPSILSRDPFVGVDFQEQRRCNQAQRAGDEEG